MTNQEGGQWQLAFWIVTIVCGISISGVTAFVYQQGIRYAEATDDVKKQAKEGDREVVQRFEKRMEKLEIKVDRVAKDLQSQQIQMIEYSTKILGKLEFLEKKAKKDN